MRYVSSRGWVPIALACALAGAAALSGQEPDGEQIAQARKILTGVPDRDARRNLLDRFRRGKLDLDGLSAAAQGAPAAGAPAAPSKSDPHRPLGATVADGATTFRVFSPRAFSMSVHVYDEPTGGKPRSAPMVKADDGIWEATVSGVGYGKYYDFTCDGPSGPGEKFDHDRHLSDPYARANVAHDGRSLLVDPGYDWGRTASFKPPKADDLVVYELHVKDWTASASSGVTDPRKQGKYLGFTDKKLLAHLKELGVNAVELLPVHEFDNKAAPPGHINYWGYMTTHFFAPETSLSSGTAKGEAVRELKDAIKALHEAGIAVILDVVYNHTAEGDNAGPVLNLKGFDNGYYYRLTPDKLFYMNGTGCGNELKSESPMARRLIIDSLKYFMREYKVDGFRLDLGASLDKDTMFAIDDAMPPGTILIAEPWTADWNRRFWDKPDMKGRRWALWNDGFRDNLRGFIAGSGKRNDVITALAGSCMWFAGKPAQSINYLECHDGAVLADILNGDQKRNRLGAVALLTAQGIPMLQSGQEFGRTKKHNENSYDQDNDINWIDWTLKDKNRALFDFYAGLTSLRAKYPALRQANCLTDNTVTWQKPDNERALGYLLKGAGGPGVMVLLNSDPSNWVTFPLPAGSWPVLCNGERVALDGSLGTAAGDYRVPPQTGVVLRTP
jgi:pullulanase/glycogen debranching enzyme